MSFVSFSGARDHCFMVNCEDFLSGQAGHQEPPTAPTPAVSSRAATAWSGDLGMWPKSQGTIHWKINIAMENHHFWWVNQKKWPFSIAMLNYQRVLFLSFSDIVFFWIFVGFFGWTLGIFGDFVDFWYANEIKTGDFDILTKNPWTAFPHMWLVS